MNERDKDADDQRANVVALDPRAGRPDPPRELTADEAAEWRRLVGCMPRNWVRPKNAETLADYCRYFALTCTASREIKTMLAQGADLDALARPLALGELAALAMLECATKLKITPESQGADWVVYPDA